MDRERNGMEVLLGGLKARKREGSM